MRCLSASRATPKPRRLSFHPSSFIPHPFPLGIHRSRQLIPNLDLVAVGITEEQVWLARTKLTMADDISPGSFHGPQRQFNIGGIEQPKTEMGDSSGQTSPGCSLLKDENVPGAGRLRLNKALLLVDCDDAEHLLIKPQGAPGILNRESDVRQTMGSNCSRACSHRPNETQDQRPLA